MNWRCWAMPVIILAVFAACPVVAYGDFVGDIFGDDADDDPIKSMDRDEARRRQAEEDAKRKEEDTHRHQLLVNRFYVELAKHKVDKQWRGWDPPARGSLLITKVKLTLDPRGKVVAVSKIGSSGSEVEDKSVQNCFESVDFGNLPPGLDSLYLFLTFMSDGSSNRVECTDSSEANAYYTDLVGGRLSPKGDGIITPNTEKNTAGATPRSLFQLAE